MPGRMLSSNDTQRPTLPENVAAVADQWRTRLPQQQDLSTFRCQGRKNYGMVVVFLAGFLCQLSTFFPLRCAFAYGTLAALSS